ncbi:MAG: ribbon-helix-helix protein, CopG family [Acidobacteriaceae bacterium]|nr:ribbon-helix-helix protein, CopG family [Acidobacteriaceae bacterium]
MRISKVLSVSLPPEMHSWAEEIARSENRTMSELVREALRAYKALRLRTEKGQQSKSKFTEQGSRRSK